MTDDATTAFVQQLFDAMALGISPALGRDVELAMRKPGDATAAVDGAVEIVIATGSEPFVVELDPELAELFATVADGGASDPESTDPDARATAAIQAIAEGIASQLEAPLRMRWPSAAPRLEGVHGGRAGPRRADATRAAGSAVFVADCRVAAEPAGALSLVLPPAALLRLGFATERRAGAGPARAPLRVVRLAAADDDGGDLTLLDDPTRFETRVVASVDELADALRAAPADLLIVEGDRPGEPPSAILHRCRASSGRRTVTAIVLTSRPTRSAVITAFRAGARGFVVKPFERADFEQAVREALDASARSQRNVPFPAA